MDQRDSPERLGNVAVLLAISYDPHPRVRKVAATLAERGHRVDILAWDRAGIRKRLSFDGRVTVRHIQVHSRLGRGITQIPYLMVFFAHLLRQMRAVKPQIIHAVDLPMLIAALLARRLLFPNAVVVYEALEVYSVMVSHRFP